MAKYTQPNIIFDGSIAFIKNVFVDTSIYLKGTAHINAPISVSSGTPYALVLETGTGSNLIVKSKQLGTMAFATDSDYYTKTQVDDSQAIQDASIALLEAATIAAWNGLTTTDNSVGLGGTLSSPTTITTDGTNTLTLSGLTSGTTRLAIISDGGVLKTQQLGTISLEDANDYVEIAGDTMTGDLIVPGISVTLDVSIGRDLTVIGDALVGGNLTIDGSLFVRSVESIDVSSAFIVLNTGQSGIPPATMQSGIIVDRGDLEPYVFIYDESQNTFRIGIAEFDASQYQDASTQAVATREDTPIAEGITFFNNDLYRFDTHANITFNATTGLDLGAPLDVASGNNTSLNGGLTIGGLSLGTNAYALMASAANGSVVTTRLLKSPAWTDPANLTINGPLSISGGAGSVLSTIDISILKSSATSDGYLSSTDWSIFNAKQDDLIPNTDGEIAIMEDVSIASLSAGIALGISGYPGQLISIDACIATSSSLGVVKTGAGISVSIAGEITPTWGGSGILNTVARTDHNHNTTYIGTVTEATNSSGHNVLAAQDVSIVYLKYIKQGNGTTITSDASAITIAVTGVDGFASKYIGNFSGVIDTSVIFEATTHNLGEGPFNISVYELRRRVYTENSFDINGDVKLEWTAGSLSGDCSVFITG